MVKTLSNFFYIILLSGILIYSLVSTQLAPDAYVFIQHMVSDRLGNNLEFNSLKNNVFFFDAASIFANKIEINELYQYLILAIISYVLVFYVKYVHYCAKANIFGLTLIFITSFLAYDLNGLRFNLATLLLLYSFRYRKKWVDYFLKTFSFLTHILPIAVLVSARFYYLPLLLFPIFLSFISDENSRFLLYFNFEEFKFFKVLLLFFPNLIFLWHYKSTHHKNKVADLAVSYIIISFFALIFNTELSARFVEGAFYLIVLWWVLEECRSKVLGLILWFFAIAMATSRMLNGIDGTQDFFFTI